MDKIPFDPYDFFGYLASGAVVLLGMQFVFGFPVVLGQEFKVIEGIILLLAAYVGGHLMATPAKALLESLVVAKVLRRPSVNLLQPRTHSIRARIFPDYFTPLPNNVWHSVRSKAEAKGVEGLGEPLFLHVRYCTETQDNEKLLAKLAIYRTKFGFARNLSFTCILFAVALGVKIIMTPSPDPNMVTTIVRPDPHLAKYAFTAAVVGILLFYRYLKFFRQYSYELFNSYGGR